MKILITIILMALSTNLYSQITVSGKDYKKGEVVKSEGNEIFIGKYVSKSDTGIFTLFLKKELFRPDSNNPFELITGSYDYSKNGKTVYSNAEDPVKYGNLAGREVLDGKLNISFKDGTTGASAKGWIAFNSDGKLIWKIAQHDGEGIRFVGHRKDLFVPTEMIFEKVPN